MSDEFVDGEDQRSLIQDPSVGRELRPRGSTRRLVCGGLLAFVLVASALAVWRRSASDADTNGILELSEDTQDSLATPIATPKNGYVVAKGNCAGQNMDLGTRVSRDECARNCDADDCCQGFSYSNGDDGLCRLKWAVCDHPEPASSTFHTKGALINVAPGDGAGASAPTAELVVRQATCSDMLNYKKWDGNCVGQTMAREQGFHRIECAHRCDINPGCAGFSYFGDGKGECELKSGACSRSDVEKDDGYIFYEKLNSDDRPRPTPLPSPAEEQHWDDSPTPSPSPALLDQMANMGSDEAAFKVVEVNEAVESRRRQNVVQ